MKFNKSAGQISRTLIILAIIVLVAIVVVYFVTKITSTRKSQSLKLESSEVNSEPPKPIYETTIGDVKFLFESTKDLGNVLSATLPYQQDLTTTEKFIKVVIGAQNKGKNDITQNSWDIGNIVDSDGRNFVSIGNRAYYWLPRPDLCGSVLKPEFEPVPCVKIYEVSKISTNLKVVVKASNQNLSKKQESFIDLIITQ